jgi:hypothetical protein
VKKKMKSTKPIASEVEPTRQYLRERWPKIALHALYLGWGLPTARLRKIREIKR